MLTKRTDAKGRVALGSKFANKMVILEEVDDCEINVKIATVVPQNEAWLHKNREAKASVFRGLAQLKSGKVSKGPDLAAGADLVRRIEST